MRERAKGARGDSTAARAMYGVNHICELGVKPHFGSEPLQEKAMPRDTLLTLSDTHSTLKAFIAATIMRTRDGAPRTGDTPFYRSNNHSLTNLRILPSLVTLALTLPLILPS